MVGLMKKNYSVVCIITLKICFWYLRTSVGKYQAENSTSTFLLDFKMRRMTEEVSLKPTDLIPLINKAWNASFARKEKKTGNYG